MDNVKNAYLHVGVDPYANLKYQHYDNSEAYTADYTNEMRDQLLKDMEPYIKAGKFTLVNMTDTEFMNESKHMHSKFAFVHFDGPHMTKDVINEAIWFANRTAPHTRFVFDDIKSYRMDLVAHLAEFYGFKTIETGTNKICLEKK